MRDLQCLGFLAQFFPKVRMADFLHLFNEDSSFVQMATPETPCGKVSFCLPHSISGSVKSEIKCFTYSVQDNLFQKFRMATFVHSLHGSATYISKEIRERRGRERGRERGRGVF